MDKCEVCGSKSIVGHSTYDGGFLWECTKCGSMSKVELPLRHLDWITTLLLILATCGLFWYVYKLLA